MIVRPAAAADLDAYLAIQEEEWHDGMSASRGQLESRLDHVGELMAVAEHDGLVVGGSTTMLLADYDVGEHRSWEDTTDSGWCTNHQPGGRFLFGVDLSVSRRAPRSTVTRMMAHLTETSIRLGVEQAFWGSRLPRYHRYADQMSAEEYAFSRNARGRYLDPEIQIYSRIPGVRLVGVVPNYFKDADSLDHGAIFAWTNPVRRSRLLRPLARPIVAATYRRQRRRRNR